MKKLLAFLLAATMLVAIFAVPAAAADSDSVNYEAEIKFTKKAPSIDGVVKKGEYSTTPLHSYPDDKSQFVDNEHNDYDESDWDFDFYATWDKENLYLAWVLNTETHICIPENDFNSDGSWSEGDYGYMWMYSCVQFIFTPSAPKKGETSFQTSAYGGDYLEVGLALTEEGNQIRIAWNKPTNAQALNYNDWDAVIARDEDKKTTTYEVRIPWGQSGLTEAGNNAQFGLTYAVAAQKYDDKHGMIEWQNGVLTSKDADSAAVITLTGAPDDNKIEIEQPKPELTDGTLPADATGTLIAIDDVNTRISGEMAYIYTDPSKVSEMNNNWATSVLLAPVEGETGYYTVVETKTGSGEPYSFDTEITEGMIAFIAHTAGEEGSTGKDRAEATKSLVVGDKLGLFGVDLAKAERLYKNATLYVVPVTEGETSEPEVSEPEVSETESEAESSEVESTVESTVESEEESTAAPVEEEEGGLGIWLWIIIAVVVVAIVVVVIVFTKKK
jgi:hypothetical protein